MEQYVLSPEEVTTLQAVAEKHQALQASMNAELQRLNAAHYHTMAAFARAGGLPDGEYQLDKLPDGRLVVKVDGETEISASS